MWPSSRAPLHSRCRDARSKRDFHASNISARMASASSLRLWGEEYLELTMTRCASTGSTSALDVVGDAVIPPLVIGQRLSGAMQRQRSARTDPDQQKLRSPRGLDYGHDVIEQGFVDADPGTSAWASGCPRLAAQDRALDLGADSAGAGSPSPHPLRGTPFGSAAGTGPAGIPAADRCRGARSGSAWPRP